MANTKKSKRITYNLIFALGLLKKLKHWTSIKFLMDQLNVSDRTVYRYLDDLREEGFEVEEIRHYGKMMFRVRSYPTEVNHLIGSLNVLVREEVDGV